MGKKKKPFIDKKTAHSFQVVHRSQKDPLQADEDSSKRVLVPIDSVAQACADQVEKSETSISKVEQQLEYGIHFEDEYDYMQHLKTRTDCTLEPLPSNVTVIENKNVTKEFGNVKLPSEVFASGYEQEEGLLNLAAPAPGPHPEWDPDIVAALDDDLDLDEDSNILDDDFIFKANAPSNEAADEDESDDDDLIRSDKEFDDNDDEKYFPLDGEADDDSHGGLSFDDEETKSRFTSYSMTSSVIRRNKGLTMLDDKFEKVMEEYDEDEIGALDHEEVLGTVDTNADSHIINAITEEFEQTRTKVQHLLQPLQSSYTYQGATMKGKGYRGSTTMKGLTMLDDKFEKVMEEYDEDEIGALDHEEVLGTVDTNADSHIINAITEEFEQTRTKVHFSGLPLEGKGNGSKSNRTEQSSGEDDEDLVRGAEKPKEQWDCESILSKFF
ncbi:predicted protein [Nematostella vectensis]|uniref:Protein LTV1 homolog n=1 Tax=Nematostella vectensis TaxID=45351 RepID=A7SV81_NEMVE|nr:predicted protein [Nematostella vectensis]|eukprot:XP_001624502.1 predicted protein [Nematostella vectensis]